MLLNIKLFFCKYLRVPVDIKKYAGTRIMDTSTNINMGAGTNIYPVGRVRGSYYSYPTRSIDIFMHILTNKV